MLGFRGASRYAHPAYADGFALECAALTRVRDEMGLTNLSVMVPFCRRVEEAHAVIEAMAQHGLKRGENGLEIYVMCEIPNNVIQIDAFAEVFDGFSIGSNDLTQLTLGVDRDSDIVAFDFDERDPGMLEMLRLAVDGRAAQPPSRRHLRRGAGQLSRDRAVSWSGSASTRSASIPRACCRRRSPSARRSRRRKAPPVTYTPSRMASSSPPDPQGPLPSRPIGCPLPHRAARDQYFERRYGVITGGRYAFSAPCKRPSASNRPEQALRQLPIEVRSHRGEHLGRGTASCSP